MGFVRDALSKSVDFVREEIMPLQYDLMKAGILKPDQDAYEQKASLVDPWSYGQTAWGYRERYALLDYSKLRQITYADPIVASIMQTRQNQVASFCVPQKDKFRPGFRIKLREEKEEPTEKHEAIIEEITKFIMNTGVPESFEDTPLRKRRDNFDTFIRKIVRDSLTYDQINFEITPRKDGTPYSFQAVDASTIRIVPDIKEDSEKFGGYEPSSDSTEWVRGQEDNYQDGFNEFEPEYPRYVQLIQGSIKHSFDEWELAFGVRNPRTDIAAYGYGYSEIEMLIHTITAHMNAETYNRKFFSQGSTVKGILTFEGSVPPDQLEMFRRQWHAQATSIENSWKTPIMALGKEGKLHWEDLQKTNRDMEFGGWMDYCIKTICGVFQMDPIEIGFDISRQGSGDGGGGNSLGDGNQADRISHSQDKGLRPLLVHIQTLINDYVVYRIDPNFEFEFVGLNAGNEESELAQIEKKVKTHKTINEIRAEQDLDPLPSFEEIKSPGDMILDSSIINMISQQMQNAQADAEMAEQGIGPDGQPLEGGVVDPTDPHAESDVDYDSMSDEELEQHMASLSPDQLDSEIARLENDLASEPPEQDGATEIEETEEGQKKVEKSFVEFIEGLKL